MNAFTLTVLMTTVGADPAPSAPAPTYYQMLPISANGAEAPVALPTVPGSEALPGVQPEAAPPAPRPCMSDLCEAPARALFQSDHAFDGFVGPVSNAVLNKDPRSNSYARFLFINNNVPGANALGGGNIQVYALQLNLALTERLSIIADKDGLAHLAVKNAPSQTGFLNLAAGLKYTFYRNVETQTIAAAGIMYEIPTGEQKVFQDQGSGSFVPFVTFGKQFGNYWHYLQTTGYYIPVQSSQGSSFIYNSFHIDRQIGWFYPLAELNWFWYTSGGNRIPPSVGEGDGLLNLGTQGQSGAHLVSAAFGAKAVLSKNVILGAVFEVPISNRHDILNQRITVDMILRY
ncbi:hypothetical protein [Frigoriglobus tundricola]|uniref:Uncharacterized protein n=1 Tax=Frigoriglobus tundricola TaxID=2774151 RepID=A0A6M5Z212_9BACT|nr:hypothetical protein [Frigoriglobus tundricola]QJW99202.1 hypothetical protein FTUN_6802 [Frigoriglobus tundricola]